MYASRGVALRNLLSSGTSVWTEVLCRCTILNALLALGQYLVTKVGFCCSIGVSVCLLFVVVSFRAVWAVVENFICFSCEEVLALG